MTRKSVLEREKKRIRLSSDCSMRNELRRMRNDKSISMSERLKVQRKLNVMHRDRSLIRVRNRCSITGRPRGYYRRFGVSRIQLRVLAGWGLVPGLVKASW